MRFIVLALFSTVASAYPVAEKDRSFEFLHNKLINDPYRWMENGDDPRLQRWITKQNKFTDQFLTGTTYSAYASAFRDMLAKKFDGEPFLDEQEWLAGRYLPSQSEFLSPSKKYQIETISESQADYLTVRIKDVTTQQYLSDVLHAKFFGAYWVDDSSFVYISDRDSRLGGTHQAIRRHTIGRGQIEDETLLETDDAYHRLSLFSLGGIFYVNQCDEKLCRFSSLDLESSTLDLKIRYPIDYMFFGLDDKSLFFVDFTRHTNGQVVGIELETGKRRDIIAPHSLPIQVARIDGGKFFISYLDHTLSKLRVYEGGNGRDLPLPYEAVIADRYFYAADGTLYVRLQRYDRMTSYWKVDTSTYKWQLDKADLPIGYDIVSTRHFYQSVTGQKSVVWLVHRKDVTPNSDTPVFLYGYGGFRVNTLPGYWTTREPWIKRGGVLAVVTLPGGMEYGEDWYRAGIQDNKTNVFDDFAGAAKELYKKGLASPSKTVIGGGSNGGLLAAATAIRNPKLFAGSVVAVGVLDMLRFHKSTAGKWWVGDYGNADDETNFSFLFAYSPYHQLQTRHYPAFFIHTAVFDDRVSPWHSYKFAAKLQTYQAKSKAVLLNVSLTGSHGSLSGTIEDQVRSLANQWTFVEKVVGGF